MFENRHKASLWARILKFFPEQQIYFRANGIVRFISISTAVQMTAAGLLLLALGWSAMTSFYFLGRDEAIASRDDTIDVLTQAYDDASNSIMALEGDLSRRAEAIEGRQKIIEELIEGNSEFTLMDAADVPLDQHFETEPGSVLDALHDDFASLAPRLFFASGAYAAAAPDLPSGTGALSGWLSLIEADQKRMALSFSMLAERRLDEVSRVLGSAGMTLDQQLALWDQPVLTEPGSEMGTGGPFIPVSSDTALPLIYRVGDHKVGDAFAQLKHDWDRVQRVIFSLDRVPHLMPPEDYYLSSRYGPRTDPIKNIPAFHPGIDMSGWPGTKIRASATGTVVHAGWYGPYGNMVEIDHGNGFKTRYGHLRKILVEKGDVVSLGQLIGEMGKTGRVTDTHVHFEIWLNGDLNDPLPFMKVSDDVFEIKRRYAGYADFPG